MVCSPNGPKPEEEEKKETSILSSYAKKKAIVHSNFIVGLFIHFIPSVLGRQMFIIQCTNNTLKKTLQIYIGWSKA